MILLCPHNPLPRRPQITDVSIKFSVSLQTMSSTASSSSSDYSGAFSWSGSGWGSSAAFNCAYSSQQRSASQGTQSSTFSLEVMVKAGQPPMPGGMAKVLDILTEAIIYA